MESYKQRRNAIKLLHSRPEKEKRKTKSTFVWLMLV